MSGARAVGVLLWALLVGGGSYCIARRDGGGPERSATVPAPRNDPACALLEGRDTAAAGLPFTARRRLVRNHRVVAGDFARVTAAGARGGGDTVLPRGHLRCTLGAGERLARGDVVGEPVVVAPRGHAPYVLSLRDQPALVDLLDVGDRVDVWRRSTPLATNVPVLAVWCRPEDRAQCAAVVLASDETWRRLAGGADTVALRILPRRLR